MPMHWYSPNWWWICPLFMIICIVFFLVAVRRGRGSFGCPPFRWRSTNGFTMSESPKEILDRRYAAGDIEQREYEEKIQDILGT